MRVRKRPVSSSWKMALPYFFCIFDWLNSTWVVCQGSIKASTLWSVCPRWSMFSFTNLVTLKLSSNFTGHRQVPWSASKVCIPSMRVRDRPVSSAWKMTLPYFFYILNLLDSPGVVSRIWIRKPPLWLEGFGLLNSRIRYYWSQFLISLRTDRCLDQP